MARGNTWNSARDGAVYRLPGPDRLGWWAGLAMVVSVLLHVGVFIALNRTKIAFKFEEAQELSTRPLDVRQMEIAPAEAERSLPPEDVVKPPADTAKLLDDIDVANLLPKDQEIDIKPEVLEAEYAVRLQNPARAGSPEAAAPEASSGFEIEADLPELGREPASIRPAEVGQITVDPGSVQADDAELGKFTDDLIRRGANGKVAEGTLEGITSLESLLDLPSNILVGKKTMLPSDLLFEFNKSELRESAKIGLMKLGLLMDRNPGLYCWIEGHTDLVGGDEFNLNLSIKRAEAVKSYLVNSLRMDATKIITRGFGRYQPLITVGAPAEQAANRRVEIRMRKTPPDKDQMKVEPRKAAVVEEAPTPKAILVKPKRIPTEEAPPPLKAAPVDETPALREAPAFEEIPKAAPVEPEVPRAQAIEEE